MGGSFSHEFMVPAEIGDDDVDLQRCGLCGQPREGHQRALVPKDLVDAASSGAVEEFATPGIVTIAALAAAPYNVAGDQQFKTLVYIGDGKPFLSDSARQR